MFIELLIVAAVLLYLNSLGIVSFDSPYAMAISIAILVFIGTISWLVTHYIARSLVDGLFGFGSWTPKAKPTKKQEFGGPADSIEWLEQEIVKEPSNVELSKHLSRLYLQENRYEAFAAERLRIAKQGNLTVPEIAAIYNRLADMEIDHKQPEGAVKLLQEFKEAHPETPEARNAQVRIGVLEDLMERNALEKRDA